ncbi:hypothetical protein HY498_03480 [Candidatus Woesearchaeota archaeon]|nr:hypothetical protein [Candidatus Woesearchaeota archaeon]
MKKFNKDFLTTLFIIIVIFGAIIYESYYDEDKITGNASWKKIRKKIKAEAKRVETRVEKEVKRTDDNLKNLDDKAKAELKRAEKRFKKNIKNFKEDIKEAGYKIDKELNRIDDNLKELADAPKEEFERFKKKVKEEIKAQKDLIKSIRKGDVCGALNAAESSQVYDVKGIINDLASKLKPVVRPIVEKIVLTIASPLNAIPVVGNILYAAALAMIDPLTDRAVLEAVDELLEECD